MELRELFKLIRSYKKNILIFSFTLALGAVVVSETLPESYKASATIYVKRQVDKGKANYFTYEGFYSQQTAEKYTNTVLGFIKSDDIRRQALERLGISATAEELDRFNRKTEVKKVAPQLISIRVQQDSRDKAENLWKALAQTTIERVNLLNQTGDQKISIDAVNPDPLVEVVSQNSILNGITAFLLGGLFNISWIALREYLKG